MASRTTNQQAERVLRLLLGMRMPEVWQALGPYGFDQTTIETGWARLSALTPPVQSVPAMQDQGERPLFQLQGFLSTWFPIAEAALQNAAPEMGRLLLHRLGATRGAETVVAVKTFLSRLQAMEQGSEPFGQDGPGARAVLVRRGLSSQVEKEARALVERAQRVRPESPLPAHDEEREREALDELWRWYLEWSAICRVAVKNKNHLRALGFEPRRAAASRRVPAPRRAVSRRGPAPSPSREAG